MLEQFFDLDKRLIELAEKAEKQAKDAFTRIEAIASYNEAKVLRAFIKNGVSESHFKGSTGYGYDDRGREVLDAVFADVFGAEDALVRHNFVSGVLRTGDKLVAITGAPYDTMEEVIGIRGEGNGSLKDFGVSYDEVPLLDNGTPDLASIPAAVQNAKVAYIQRSRGYSLRPSLTIEHIAELVQAVKKGNPEAIIIVDNCYGELVEKKEPLAVGADLIVGSLIKNPGGGIAQTGGYIAGRKDLVELCSYRLTTPGMGKEVGCTLNQSRELFMGLFWAPSVVANAVKTSVFALSLFQLLGYEAYPQYYAERTDIIAAIKLNTPEALTAFCRGIQKGSPVDSFVTPEPWAMPGYDSDVIMAAGAFVQGSSIELSADGPIKPPYAVYFQGGLTWEHAKYGIMMSLQKIYETGKLKDILINDTES